MDIEKDIYKLLFFHLALGFISYIFEPIIFVYVPIAFCYCFFNIIKTKNADNEALYFTAYFVGAECFFRMTNALFFYETAKYSVMIFMTLGIIYKNFSSTGSVYFFIILLFLPGGIIALPNFNGDSYVRKQIVFNLMGPLALTIASVYCYSRKVYVDQLKKLLLSFVYPLLTMLVYIILYTPKSNSYAAVEANSGASGGFGPNQVSTVLGLGCFCSFVLFLFFAKNKIQKVMYTILIFLFFYRSILTFSRGGLYTALAIIFIFLIYTYFRVGLKAKFKIKTIAFVLILAGIGLFSYSIITTDGFILNRYQNKNGAGKERLDKFSGRQQIAESEISIFLKNPVFGCGIGLNKDAKKEIGATVIDAHNEITRLMAEQGLFGIIIFIFLFFIPIIYLLWNKEQIFALSFFIFWLLTISHSAMRIAAPAFVYALSLLKINFNEKATLPR